MSQFTTGTETIEAQNTFTDTLNVKAGDRVAVSISGVTDSTVTLQRKLDGTNWRDITDGSWTADAEVTYFSDASCSLRLGVKTGDYGSDTVLARLDVG